MSKTLEELVEELEKRTATLAVAQERLRITQAILELRMPYVPIATLRKILEDNTNG